MKHDNISLVSGNLKGLSIPYAPHGSQPAALGQLAVRGGILMTAEDSQGSIVWSPTVDTRKFLYPFTTHTFTSGGKVGRLGPTLAELEQAYAGASFLNTQYFNVINGIQMLTVPVEGRYRIEVEGAGRVDRSVGYYQSVEVDLPAGDILSIGVGQLGVAANKASYGGSGASHVSSAALGLIAVSGGGGGWIGSRFALNADRHARGRNVSPNNGLGGKSLKESPWYDNTILVATGGAGWLGDGLSPDANSVRAQALKDGGVGGIGAAYSYSSLVPNQSFPGGFGGGGGGSSYNGSCLGGGGGYTGGDSTILIAGASVAYAAFGGTSYINTDVATVIEERLGNTGVAKVVLTLLDW